MKRKIRSLILILAVLLLLAGCTGENETLSITFEGTRETEQGTQILFTAVNSTGYNVSLGWVGSCQIEVTTSEETYYYEPFMMEISRGKSSFDIEVENCEGEIEKIVITELCLLNKGNNNLPGDELHDVVVYDAGKNIDSFADTFGLTSSDFREVLRVIALAWLAVMLVAGIVFIIRHHKKKHRNAA